MPWLHPYNPQGASTTINEHTGIPPPSPPDTVLVDPGIGMGMAALQYRSIKSAKKLLV
jgi:hypothetical protein